MNLLLWAVTLVVTAYCAYRIGRRVELGAQEAELDRLEAQAEARGQRPGTIKLSTVKIRR